MITSIGIHWMIEIFGSVVMALLIWGCQNPLHKHHRVFNAIANNWKWRWSVGLMINLVGAVIIVLVLEN